MLIWSVVALLNRWFAELLVIGTAGATAVLCCLPFLAGLRGPGPGGTFVHPAVRSFFIVEVLGTVISFGHVWQTSLANLILLPLSYFIELGFFFVVGVMEWQRIRCLQPIPRNDLALGLMALVSLLACTFLRSGTIANNDLGWHGSLIAQFVLLVRGSQLPLLKVKRWLPLVVLGGAGTFYDQALVRFYAPLYPAGFLARADWLSPGEKLGERTLANREAYQWLRLNSKSSSRVQQNPNPAIQDTFYMLYSNRSALAGNTDCAATFGGEEKDCSPILDILKPVFARAALADSLDSACAALPVDYFVAKDTDAAWRSAQSWVWKRTPIFANDFVRVFRCGIPAGRLSQLMRVDSTCSPAKIHLVAESAVPILECHSGDSCARSSEKKEKKKI